MAVLQANTVYGDIFFLKGGQDIWQLPLTSDSSRYNLNQWLEPAQTWKADLKRPGFKDKKRGKESKRKKYYIYRPVAAVFARWNSTVYLS